MTSLWKLLFKRPAERHFARLDSHGLCQAFKRCQQQPAGSGWVEISEIRLHWLNRPLPASARVCPPVRQHKVQPALAA
ncbi:hypothetical protein [Pseudomonas fontis]|uniref:Uncharacterized protein n=1 Tax=Pseudomonas fontis TaxID=2942633 RepID=A0ABT5NT07_9PSED|nr:hypothetical protein [Pseudomonas fontis]MDD0975152.1 hypothetical protein [Pseudomonas fontis]MDD0991306.1 hypothetical protein [Pseudomonas fontis]